MKQLLFDLSNRVAIVTGGNGGIGLGMARGLADAGANIAIVARNEAKSNDAVADLRQRGIKAISVVADVTDQAAVGTMVERVKRSLDESISSSTMPASTSASRRMRSTSANGIASSIPI